MDAIAFEHMIGLPERPLPVLLTRPDQRGAVAKLHWQPADRSAGTSEPRWGLIGSPVVALMARRVFSSALSRKNDRVSWPALRATFEDLLMLQHRYPIEVAPSARAPWDEMYEDLLRGYELARLVRAPGRPTGGGKFKGTLLPFQEIGLEFMAAARKCLLADEMGLGKQMPVDARVLTPDGWRRIGEVRIGDPVIGAGGRAAKVVAVFPQGVKPSYRVAFSDGSAVEAGPEHLWTVRYWRGGRHLAEMTLTTDQMRLRPMVGRLDLAKTTLYLPMLSAPVEFRATAPPPIPPYTLGQLIANGGLGHGRARLTVPETDWSEVSAHLRAEGADFGEGRNRGSVRQVSIRGLSRALAALGLAVHSRDKMIPETYLRAAPADRLALLQGLMDGDGSVSASRNKVSYHTISRRLAEAVAELVECLGGIASVRRYAREGKPTEYPVRLRLPGGMAPFRVARKADRRDPGKNAPPVRTVTTVEYVRDVESVCIAVDAPDRLFATEHAILTHNTPQALALLDTVDDWPAVVVCQPHVQRHWEIKIEEFLTAVRAGQPKPEGSLTWLSLRGAKPSRDVPPADLYLIHYLVLRHWDGWIKARGVRSVILDEVQETRHPGTAKSDAVRSITRTARNVVGLSGTPIYNRGVEIYNVMNAISRGSLGPKVDFQEAWCLKNDPEIVEDPALLGKYLVDRKLMLRRRKDEVLTELPPKRRVVEMIDADNALFADFVREAQRLARSAFEAKDPFDRSRMEAEAVNGARRATAIAKAPAAVAFLRGLLEAGEPTLVFAHHHAMVDTILDGFECLEDRRPACITGRETLAAKSANQERFVKGETDLCIIGLRAATGLDGLQARAKCVVFAELDWSPAVHRQAEDRAHRMGQKDSVLAYYLVADVGTDPFMMEALNLKLSQFLGLMQDRDETEDDRAVAEQASKQHLERVLAMLRGV